MIYHTKQGTDQVHLSLISDMYENCDGFRLGYIHVIYCWFNYCQFIKIKCYTKQGNDLVHFSLISDFKNMVMKMLRKLRKTKGTHLTTTNVLCEIYLDQTDSIWIRNFVIKCNLLKQNAHTLSWFQKHGDEIVKENDKNQRDIFDHNEWLLQ